MLIDGVIMWFAQEVGKNYDWTSASYERVESIKVLLSIEINLNANLTYSIAESMYCSVPWKV